MKNFRNSGQEVTHTVAGADKKSGDVVPMTTMCGILACDGKIGDQVSADIEGVFELKKKAAVVCAIGDQVWWNAVDGVTKTNTDNPLGIATRAAAGGDATVYVKLVPGIKN